MGIVSTSRYILRYPVTGVRFGIITPGGVILYRIMSVHPATPGFDTYTVRFRDYESYAAWIEKMVNLSGPFTHLRMFPVSYAGEATGDHFTAFVVSGIHNMCAKVGEG